MKFETVGSVFFKQGTKKAYAVHDERYTYYIPKSQVKVIKKIPAESEYDIDTYIIEIPDWLVNKNGLPIFKLAELALVR